MAWLDTLDERAVYVSVLTLGELRYGVQRLARGSKRIRLETWIDTSFRARFAGRILPVTENIADRWGALTARAHRHGHTLPAVDALIAATAEDHNLSVATRNGTHFEAAGISVVNPWEM
jgi:predicted nucleic acid-binding protein